MSAVFPEQRGLCAAGRHRLAVMALAAIALHCAALYAIPAPADKAAGTTGELITVELAPSPAAEPVPPEAVAPAARPEPAQPKEPLPEPTQPKKSLPEPLGQGERPVRKEKKKRPQPVRQESAPVGHAATIPPATGAPLAPPAAPARRQLRETPAAPAPPAKGRNRKPVYPELARRRGQQGVVELLAHVDEQGRITDLRVQRSSGFPLLDEAALKGVRAWTFIPATRNGTAVKGTALVPVAFELR